MSKIRLFSSQGDDKAGYPGVKAGGEVAGKRKPSVADLDDKALERNIAFLAGQKNSQHNTPDEIRRLDARLTEAQRESLRRNAEWKKRKHRK